MFLVNLKNSPIIIEEKFIKVIEIKDQWVPYNKEAFFEINTELQVLLMPCSELAEALFLYEGKNF